MDTKPLYYEDCHLQTFTAQVTDCRPARDGWAVTLNATAFYPEGGGQSYDTGTLGSVRVLAVQEVAGEILHLCDGPLAVGAEVTGTIDYAPRFQRMQDHTGEHILSGLIHRRFGYHNVGFHMGKDAVTIDFDGWIPPEALWELEQEANRLIWQNLKVKTWIPSPEELETLTYRSKKPLDWPVRIVQIPGADCCACCGVHVAATGEVGLLKILNWVKFHQGIRLEILCGQAALDHLRAVYEQNRQVSQALSVPVLETGAGAQRLVQTLGEEKYKVAQLRLSHFRHIAAGFAGAANVLHFEAGLSGGELRSLAEAISQTCTGFAAVLSGEDGAWRYCLAQPGGDLRPLGKALTAALKGKGGGKPEFQQGSLAGTKAEIEDFFSRYLA